MLLSMLAHVVCAVDGAVYGVMALSLIVYSVKSVVEVNYQASWMDFVLLLVVIEMIEVTEKK